MEDQETKTDDLTKPKRVSVDLNGHSLSMLTCGPTDGKPVVLIHGFPTSAELWRPIQAKLAEQGYHTLAIELPGFGKTKCSGPGMANWNTAIDMIGALLKSNTSLKGIWWFGHQLGALMALQCAEKFSSQSERVTIIQPLFKKSQLWPEQELWVMEMSIKLGVYTKAVRSGWLEKRLYTKRFDQPKASTTNVDRYLHRHLLCNEKVLSEERQVEFVDFYKSLPVDFADETFKQLLKLNIPRQVIVDVIPTFSFIENTKLMFKSDQYDSSIHYYSVLNQIASADEIELVGLKSHSPYLPLSNSNLCTEIALLWAKPGTQEEFIASYQQAHKKPEPLAYIEPPEIKIDPSLSLPPDGRPDRLQPGAETGEKRKRRKRRTKATPPKP